MATKPRTGTVILDGDDKDPQSAQTQAQADFDEADALEDGALIAITEEVLQTVGSKVRVTRLEPREYQGHVATLAPGEFSTEKIADECGPGLYMVRFVSPKGRLMPGGGQLRIAPKSTHRGESPAASNDPRSIMDYLDRQEAKREERREREEAAARERRGRLIELTLAALPGIGAVISAMKGGNSELLTVLASALKPQPAPNLQDMVVTLQGLRDLSGAGKAPDEFDKLSKLLTLAKELGGDGESKGSNTIDLLRDGLKALPEVLASLPTLQARTVQVMPAAPGQMAEVSAISPPQSTEQPTAGPQAPGAADMMKFVENLLHEIATKIEGWARQGRDAALRAEVLLEELPEWAIRQVEPEQALEWLKREDWWQRVVSFHPTIEPFKAWCENLRAELIAIFEEQVQKKTPPSGD